MSHSREDQLADDLFSRARSYAKQLGGAVEKEVTLDMSDPDIVIAARRLEQRGVAEFEGSQVTIHAKHPAPWLR